MLHGLMFPPDSLSAIVMAAGAGSRMGGRPKALLMRAGVSLIERHLRALAEAGVRQGVVVLGHHAERIEPILLKLKPQLADSLELRWTLNPKPDDGPGSSLRAGLLALPSELSAVLVALADQPLIEPEDIAAVMSAWQSRASSAQLLVPCFQGQPGHPLIFSAAVRAEIVEMTGGAGLRDWRRAHPNQVEMMQADHPRYTMDVDSEADRAALREKFGIALEWPEDQARM